jgi:CMP-N,N'-diacetyllegionaminic acid synthase
MSEDYKKVALIPARSGSKRIIDKNIYPLNGYPLIAYTIVLAIQSNIYDDIFVITDSEKYAEISKKFGAKVPFLRPKSISGDISPDIEWVKYSLNKLEALGNKYDIFSILRPTSPFRSIQMLKNSMEKFLHSSKIDSLRAIEKCTQHPGKMWVVSNNKQIMTPLFPLRINDTYWHSNQYSSLPEIYVQNASLEISWTRNVIENNSISGEIIMPYETESFEGFDINNIVDIYLAETLIKNNYVKTLING